MKEKIIKMLEEYLENNPIVWYNEFTVCHSRIERKTIRKIIEMIQKMEV